LVNTPRAALTGQKLIKWRLPLSQYARLISTMLYASWKSMREDGDTFPVGVPIVALTPKEEPIPA